MNTIGYLGPEGSFSEEALFIFLQDNPGLAEKNTTIAFPSIHQAIEACKQRQIDWAFVPLENSTEGQVSATLDSMMQSEELLIHQEYVHLVNQCLLTPKPMPLNEIQRVFSHPQGLGQCRSFINNYLRHAEQVNTPSTAEAAKSIANNENNWAAIAPKRAALVYGLYCQNENIQDNEENKTRFALIGYKLHEMTGTDKTSLLLGVKNCPGSLYEVLQEFAIRQINMTKIESRPSKEKLGEYVFFIDIEGYVFMPVIQEALFALKNKKVPLRLLGSYPKKF